MALETPRSSYEQEIAEISKVIEARRNTLEREVGIEEQEETAKAVIAETIQSIAHSTAPTPPPPSDGVSYLDTISGDSAEAVNALIDEVQTKGLKAAIADAQEKSPYLLDAFHDALVDKLYEEMKRLNYV